MYLAFWDVVFVCVKNDVCEDGVCSVLCMSGGGRMSEKAASVSSELCPVYFPMVREHVSVLL